MTERKNEPIAIIGIGCRFPGGASSPIIRLPIQFVDLLIPIVPVGAGTIHGKENTVTKTCLFNSPGKKLKRFINPPHGSGIPSFISGIDGQDAVFFNYKIFQNQIHLGGHFKSFPKRVGPDWNDDEFLNFKIIGR